MTGPVSPSWPERPYKGLGYYTESDALLFAGRDEDTRVCAAMLAESRIRVLLLHGSTGCGKSSFLRAGLVPFLESRRAGLAFARTSPQSAAQILFIRSTPEPLAALAHALFRFASNRVQVETPDGIKTIDLTSTLPPGSGTDAAEFLREFATDPDALLQVLDGLSRLLSDTLILIIDQAEEILTLEGTGKQHEWRDAFFGFLAEFCRRQFDLKLLISLRTEFLGRFLAKARRQIHEAGMTEFFLDDLDESQIRDAILRPTSSTPIGRHGPPCEKYRFSFADDVVREVITQVGQASGGKLTALQMVCSALYERAAATGARRITVETLRSIGGVEGSIERFVDDTLFDCGRLANLAPMLCDQEAIRWKQVLYGLVRAQPDGTVTSDLREVDVLRHELADSRLPFDDTATHLVRNLLLRPVSVVDVSSGAIVPCFGLGHDALGLVLRSWKKRYDRVSVPVQSGADDFEEEPRHTERDVALCLSGDGYQSMLFNLGALWRLNELGVLPRIARVSGVSGGAIVGALLGHRWRELRLVNGVAQNFDSTIALPLRRLADQTIAGPRVIPALFGRGTRGSHPLVDALERHLYGHATLRELSDEPIVILTATNLQCASLFHFSKSYLFDAQLGKVRASRLSLATAVAASSAVVPTSPVVLTFEDADWERLPEPASPEEPNRKKVFLADGGIYDNLALEGAWKRHRTILISDGSANLEPARKPPTDLIAQIVRLVGVMDHSLHGIRRQQVADAFEDGDKQGAFWTRRDGLDGELSLSMNVNRTRSELATRRVFEQLSIEAQEDLINWGYAACDSALRRNTRALGYFDLPAKLPYSRG